jgi:hypothetical protein
VYGVLLDDVKRLRAQVASLERELERWRHGVTIEGDHVCPDSLALNDARSALCDALSWISNVWSNDDHWCHYASPIMDQIEAALAGKPTP